MAADYLKNDPFERDVEQAITALKKGTHLLKYGRRGKPKFCPFRLSNDETMLIWYSGRMEKQLNLIQVSRIIPGQRTAIFLRHPRPDKEYQSFSLIYGQRSLDLICKDKDEAEVWFVALKALISRRACKWTIQTKHDKASYRPTNHTCGNSSLASSCCSTNVENMVPKSIQQCGTNHDARPFANFGNIFSDVILYTEEERDRVSTGSASTSKSIISGSADTPDEGVGVSGVDHNVRVSYSSTVSSCSYGSGDDFDSMGDVLLWGKGVGDGKLAYSSHLSRNSYDSRIDASLPKALESTVLLDIHSIACGSKHSVLVTKQGEIYSWGEESGGSRLGHGVDTDVTHPKLISALSGISIESVACGEFHTCAVSFCGDLYTWGDGMHSFGLLGHGNDTAHCIPKKVCGPLDGLQVSSVSCGPWHTAVVTSAGQLFTFGDGVFGALGHGDRRSTNVAREVVSLRGMRTVRAACGAWHTVAIVEVVDSLNSCTSCKLFAWGDGNKGQLGHPDRVARLLPAPVESLLKPSFCQVSCGYDFTVALSTSGQVYTMGSNASGQLGNPTNDGKLHSIIIKGSISSRYVEGIACGSHHVAVLTSKAEVYTWGKGANGRLGHGNNFDRNTPTLVEALKDKQVKSVVCGTDFTAAVCLHKCTSGLDQSICSGCRLQFGFRRKRHNCYNCGLLYCDACSTRKSMKASLAPNSHKTYRVCDECYTKLNTVGDAKYVQNSKLDGNPQQLSSEATDKENRVKNLRVRLSKILTTEPFKPDGKHSRSNSRFPLHHSGNLSVGSINFVGHSKGLISLGNHTSTTSPLSSKPSSPHFTNTLTTSGLASPDYACTYLSNKNLTEEVARLQSQVSELTHKSELLEAELDRTNNQLREAKTTADVENLKCKAAKEVISSLTTQIKSITETAPEECTVVNDSWTGQESKLLGSHFCENHLNDVSRSPDSSVHLAHQLPCKGNGAVADTDWIEQVERGVHITLFRSPAGHKYLRRVRFSKRHFTEEQAARWWAEHRPTLQEQYGILTGDSIIPSRTSQEKG